MRKSRRIWISRSTCAAIFCSRSVRCSFSMNARASREAEQRASAMLRAVDEDREHLGLEPLAVADRARHLAEVLGPARALHVGLGLQVLALDVGDDALEAGRVGHLAAVAVLPLHLDLEVVAVQHGVLHVLRQLAPRGLEREAEVAGEAVEQLLVVVEEALALRRPRDDDALGDAQRVVAEQQLVVDRHARAEAGALRAGAERRVEREGARLDLGELDRVAVRAGQLLAEVLPGVGALAVDVVDLARGRR